MAVANVMTRSRPAQVGRGPVLSHWVRGRSLQPGDVYQALSWRFSPTATHEQRAVKFAIAISRTLRTAHVATNTDERHNGLSTGAKFAAAATLLCY